MPIGVVPALILGGATAGSAAISAHASNKAANEEQQAGDRALQVQQREYQQAQQQLAPFRAMGTSTLGSLYNLAEQAPVTASPTGFGYSAPTLPPMTGSFGSLAASMDMVMLRAPNGQTQAVPANQVGHYLARGATRIMPSTPTGQARL